MPNYNIPELLWDGALNPRSVTRWSRARISAAEACNRLGRLPEHGSDEILSARRALRITRGRRSGSLHRMLHWGCNN
jgi:hypothetical protein